MKQRIITSAVFNWRPLPCGGEESDTYIVGNHGLVRILDVSEHGSTCYRLENDDGSAWILWNPNAVFEDEVER